MKNILFIISIVYSSMAIGQMRSDAYLKSSSHIGRADLGLFSAHKPKSFLQKDTSLVLPWITVQVGAGPVFSDSRTQLNSSGHVGSNINLEDNLGLAATTITPRFNVIFRLSRIQQVYFDFYSIRRKEDKVLEGDIRYGEGFYPANTFVKSKLNIFNFHLAYVYNFLNGQRTSLGLLAGASALDYSLKMESATVSEKDGLLLFFPHIGLVGTVYISKKCLFRGVVKFSASPFKNYDYTMLSIKPYIEYYFTKNLGVGMRYHYAYGSVDQVSKEKFNGNFRYQLHSIALFVCFRFFKK